VMIATAQPWPRYGVSYNGSKTFRRDMPIVASMLDQFAFLVGPTRSFEQGLFSSHLRRLSCCSKLA
jgi:alpha-N-acetylglucosamine transferase